jgi:quinol-cytochrome oxidoreductase complex cytochrome b subunit
MESRTKRFVIGLILVILAIALAYGGYRLLHDNIPEPGLDTGSGTVAGFVPPFPHA